MPYQHTDYNIETEFINCPLCNSNKNRLVLRNRDWLTDVDDCFNLVECLDCNLFYINPRPKEQELHKFYPDIYPAYTNHMYFNKNDIVNFSKIIFRISYWFRKFPLTKIIWKLFITKIKVCREVDLRVVKLNYDSKVLDIGCATGLFLSHIRWLTNCKMNGVEANDKSRGTANQLLGSQVVFKDIAEVVESGGQKFDLITMWFVLEHLIEPLQVLRKSYDLLKQDGHLVMAVPNLDSWGRKIFKNKWFGFDVPRHLQIFNKDTLAALLEKSNFKIVKIRYAISPHSFVGSIQLTFFGKRYCRFKGQYATGLQNSIFLRLLVWPFCFLSAVFRKSDTIVIYAKKTT